MENKEEKGRWGAAMRSMLDAQLRLFCNNECHGNLHNIALLSTSNRS